MTFNPKHFTEAYHNIPPNFLTHTRVHVFRSRVANGAQFIQLYRECVEVHRGVPLDALQALTLLDNSSPIALCSHVALACHIVASGSTTTRLFFAETTPDIRPLYVSPLLAITQYMRVFDIDYPEHIPLETLLDALGILLASPRQFFANELFYDDYPLYCSLDGYARDLVQGFWHDISDEEKRRIQRPIYAHHFTP